MFKKIAALATALLFFLSLTAQAIPLAPAIPDTTHHLGQVRVDNWSWMKDREHPLLDEHLSAEDRYARSLLDVNGKLTKQIQREFTSNIPKIQSSYPYEQDGYLYYSKDFKNKPYPLHFRKKNTVGAKEELIMDENKLARGKSFFALGVFAVSPDAGTLAYSVDYLGDEVYTLYLKDLVTGRSRATGLAGISEFVWLNDSQHAIITKQNTRLQVDSCYRLDTIDNGISLLYIESDPAWDLGLYISGDREYVILSSSSKDSNENRYLSRNDFYGEPHLLLAREEGHQCYPDIMGERLYLHTNLWNPDYAFAVTQLSQPDTTNWQQLIPPQDGVSLSSVMVFKDYLVAIRRLSGFERIQVIDLKSLETVYEITPASPSDLSFWHNPNPDAASFTYTIENELTPYSIYQFCFIDGSKKLLYQNPVPKGFNRDNYIAKLVEVQVSDGTTIPLSMIYSKNLDTSIPQPMWLSGYGAYGDTNDPYFSGTLFSLLDRGYIYAVAHIRGGGEFGQAWYDAGRLMSKMNSFTDFIACMDYVKDNKISSPDLLVIEGGSAGGLLMGAVTNLAPQKMRLVIADVPFVDVISTMLDESLPLTLQEYEEWGNPHDEQVFSYIAQYSPYDNVTPARYPAMLISAAWFDTRVGYWEGLKWAQMLRANNLGKNPILFRLLYHEGHTGSTDRFKSLHTLAETYAYAISLIHL